VSADETKPPENDKPQAEASEPAVEAPKPVDEASRSAAEAPKASAEAPKPAAEAPKPAAEAPKPAAEPPKPKPKPPDPLLAKVPSPAVDRLLAALPGATGEPHYFAGEVTLHVDGNRLVEVCTFLRDDPACAFEMLVDATGTDFPEEEKRFRVVYHLASLRHVQRLRLRTHVAEGESLPTLTGIWPGINWFEREIFDLLGISFEGHPSLVRILMPDDWVGYPLRKDYPLPGYPEHHLRYREADVTRRRYVDISWQSTGERAAGIVKKYKGSMGAAESAPHVPATVADDDGDEAGT
jgi:NADH/F420H2 dehydrogenase subunit C